MGWLSNEEMEVQGTSTLALDRAVEGLEGLLCRKARKVLLEFGRGDGVSGRVREDFLAKQAFSLQAFSSLQECVGNVDGAWVCLEATVMVVEHVPNPLPKG